MKHFASRFWGVVVGVVVGEEEEEDWWLVMFPSDRSLADWLPPAHSDTPALALAWRTEEPTTASSLTSQSRGDRTTQFYK